jgi:hypothetical protein
MHPRACSAFEANQDCYLVVASAQSWSEGVPESSLHSIKFELFGAIMRETRTASIDLRTSHATPNSLQILWTCAEVCNAVVGMLLVPS